ncbi:MAG: hypothetical protein KC547_10970 [Anaerolineae bacterium]|nr:hypothetical protein [Anaerolineae bacterium]
MPRGNGNEFADLLTGALYAIRWREGKTLSLIQDELGLAIGRDGSSPLIYWRRGHIPAKFADIDGMAKAIARRVNMGQDWAKRYYRAAGVSDFEARAAALYPADGIYVSFTNEQPSSPQKVSRVIGRGNLIDEVLTALSDPDAPSVVTFDGMGGIGKTTLISRIAQICTDEKLFDDVIQVTASSHSYPTPPVIGGGALTLDMLMNNIAEQLHIPQFARFDREDKMLRIRTALGNRRALVVVDNLETAQMRENEVAEILRSLLGQSKALLASRRRFSGDYYSLHLSGLGEEEGLEFLQRQAVYRRINRVASADHQDLYRISNVTGGSPLAMKLVLGQLAHLALPTVLDHLRSVKPIRSLGEQDEYTQLYRYIFFPSWQTVELPAQRLLVSMAHFAADVGDDIDIVQEVSELDDADMANAISQLWLTSLMEIDERSSLQQPRYYLHALTQYFVLSDIVKS